MQLTMRGAMLPRALPVLVLVVCILGALLAAALAGAARPTPVANGIIAYVSDGQVWLSNSDGTGAHAITSGGATTKDVPLLSGDATRIAYLDNEGQYPSLMIAGVDGSRPVAIAREARMLRYASWTPDGESIVFSRWDYEVAGQHDRVFIAPADGSGEPVRIGDPDLSAFDPLVSPGGDKIAFLSDHCQPGDCPAGPSTFALHVMAIDGSGVVQLAFPIASLDNGANKWSRLVDWSPDGSTILFTGHDPDAPDLPAVYTVPSDGSSAPVRIDRGAAGALSAAWSPAGGLVAFVELDEPDSGTLVVTDPTSGSRQVVHAGVRPFAPAWSPDGRLVAFISPEGSSDSTIRIKDARAPEETLASIPLRGAPGSSSGASGAVSWQGVEP